MPTFTLTRDSTAPPEAVWKLLYDPSRFPEWWFGIETVELTSEGAYTYFPTGYPDFPMPQLLRSTVEDHSVKISCLVSDIAYEWQLTERSVGTTIGVRVEIPDVEAHRLATLEEAVRRSLENLAELAPGPRV